jgi:hypothetical protein
MVIKRNHSKFFNARTLASAQRLRMGHENADTVRKNRGLILRSIELEAQKMLRAVERHSLARRTPGNGQYVWDVGKQNTQRTAPGSTGLLEQRT